MQIQSFGFFPSCEQGCELYVGSSSTRRPCVKLEGEPEESLLQQAARENHQPPRRGMLH